LSDKLEDGVSRRLRIKEDVNRPFAKRREWSGSAAGHPDRQRLPSDGHDPGTARRRADHLKSETGWTKWEAVRKAAAGLNSEGKSDPLFAVAVTGMPLRRRVDFLRP
jgi:hypothetical protein